MKYYLITLLFSICLFTSCQQENPLLINASGTVIDPADNPVKDVRVVVTSSNPENSFSESEVIASTTTDENGTYQLKAIVNDYGSYYIFLPEETFSIKSLTTTDYWDYNYYDQSDLILSPYEREQHEVTLLDDSYAKVYISVYTDRINTWSIESVLMDEKGAVLSGPVSCYTYDYCRFPAYIYVEKGQYIKLVHSITTDTGTETQQDSVYISNSTSSTTFYNTIY